jgi:two-component system LytT family response regulator
MAIDKAKARINSRKTNLNLEMLLQNIQSAGQDHHQIALPSREGLLFVKVRDIIYCESDGAYTKFHLRSGPVVMTSKNLKEYEELLTDYHFFRIHHAYLVNLKEVVRYIRGDGGQVVLSNNSTLDVSKRKKDLFLTQLANK